MSGSATRRGIYWICRFAFILYLLVLVYFLFFCDHYGRSVQYETIKYNLVPFHEIQRYFQHREAFTVELFFANIAGNVGLFIPFGAMLFVWKGRPVRFLEVTGWSVLVSVLIELMQLVTRLGVFDVDDIILNTVGGIFGFFVYLIVRTIYRRRKHVKRKKEL